MSEICSATADDRDGIIHVIRTVYDEYGFVLDVDDEMPDLNDLEAQYDGVNGAFFVAVVDSKIVGTIGIQRHDDDTAEIFRLYVLPNQRGKHLGYRLVETVLAWARQQHFNHIILWTDTRFDKAHKLYSRMGFVQGEERQLEDINHSREYHFALQLSGDL